MKDIYIYILIFLIIVLFVFCVLLIFGDYMYIYLGNVFDRSNGNKNCIFIFLICFSNIVFFLGVLDK